MDHREYEDVQPPPADFLHLPSPTGVHDLWASKDSVVDEGSPTAWADHNQQQHVPPSALKMPSPVDAFQQSLESFAQDESGKPALHF